MCSIASIQFQSAVCCWLKTICPQISKHLHFNKIITSSCVWTRIVLGGVRCCSTLIDFCVECVGWCWTNEGVEFQKTLPEFSLSVLSFPSANTDTVVHYNKGQPSPLSSNWRAGMAAGLAHNGFPKFDNRSRPGESLSEFTGCSSGTTTT